MNRPLAPTSAVLAAALLSLSTAFAGSAALALDTTADLKAGREALDRGDGPTAVSLLESVLLTVPSGERGAVLDDLRRAYERAASQAEAAGDSRQARSYRENLQIINRARRSANPAPPTPAPGSEPVAEPSNPPAVPALDDPIPPPDSSGLIPVEDDSSILADADAESERLIDIPDPISSPPVTSPSPAPAPTPTPTPTPIDPIEAIEAPKSDPSAGRTSTPTSPPTSAPDPNLAVAEMLRSADVAFRSQKYEEAGRVYAAMAQRGMLPESHKSVWAYCRFVAVARRINAQPGSPAEWSAIHAEIREVRALAPEIWFSEYLRRLAAERSAAVGARPSGFVVRGQSGSAGNSSATGAWQVLESENFRVYHVDPELAERLSRRAEHARAELFRYWTGSEVASNWSPRCDIYLYPDASIYSQMTGQAIDSPGFSTMGLNGGRVVARRINLRADAEGVVDAVTPHEVSHVVTADLFPRQQVPRWADEGMAILAEPTEAQETRLADLDSPLSSGRVFGTGPMMTSPAPDNRFWELYMAQSASLTRFLVQLDSPARFLTFLRDAERLGPEAALRSSYGFEKFDDLHSRWVSYAQRGRSAESPALLAVRPEGTTQAR